MHLPPTSLKPSIQDLTTHLPETQETSATWTPGRAVQLVCQCMFGVDGQKGGSLLSLAGSLPAVTHEVFSGRAGSARSDVGLDVDTLSFSLNLERNGTESDSPDKRPLHPVHCKDEVPHRKDP